MEKECSAVLVRRGVRLAVQGTALCAALCIGLCAVSCASQGGLSAKEAADAEAARNFIADYPVEEIGRAVVNTAPQKSTDFTPRELVFTFDPRINTAMVDFRFGVNSVVLTLDATSRPVLLGAMRRYIDDYAAGLLTEKKSARSCFGSTPAGMAWGLIGTGYITEAELRFEYESADSRPYFLISSAVTESTGTSEGNSPALRIFASPKQCAQILEILDQKRLVDWYASRTAGANDFEIDSEFDGKTGESAPDGGID